MTYKIKNINFDYDEISDVLYANLGKPIKAKSEEYENGIIFRVDLASGKYIGFTILDYRERLKLGILKTIPHFDGIDLPSVI